MKIFDTFELPVMADRVNLSIIRVRQLLAGRDYWVINRVPLRLADCVLLPLNGFPVIKLLEHHKPIMSRN